MTSSRPPHLVHIYEFEQDLVRQVAVYLARGIERREVALVIANPAHAEAFTAALAEAGIDVSWALDTGRLMVVDAATMLSRFMIKGWPDAARFDAVVGELIRGITRTGRKVCGYGEMVALLWEKGLTHAALELEGLWNSLQSIVDFSLFCAYPKELVDEDGEQAVHAVHTESIGARAISSAELTAPIT
jgi:hypothetical protein